MLNNIPNELKRLNQWVVADMTLNEKGSPKKAPLNPRTGQLADVTNSATWGSYEEAIATGSQHIGFVISKDDPYTFIDLDDKPDNPASEVEKERFGQIIKALNSYTELSTSGRGVHIVVKGKIPRGVHRSHVEIYSDSRYMICTGNVVHNVSIEERQDLLDIIFSEMQPVETATLVQIDSNLPDDAIWQRASNAVNKDKFIKLCNGDMTGYPSQSEADFALLAIMAFYTKDNAQVRRLFRLTELGKRDKATKNDKYINYALSKIRTYELPPIDFSVLKQNVEAALSKTNAQAPVTETDEVVPYAASYKLLPGLVGELTEYFMSTAIRPVYEIALSATLALMAGVAARSYNISDTGLNLYIILLAKTGAGKEGAAQGIEKLINAVRPQIPAIDGFIGPAVFSSGQALVKMLGDKPCFVSVLGEFGLTLQQISHPRASSAEKTLKRVLLDLYNKSGKKDMLRGSVYSDSDKNTKVVQSPAVTILGESTPETFFDALSESQISEGLIPRFSIIQYEGKRLPRNLNSGHRPQDSLTSRFSEFVAASLTATNGNTCITVQTDGEAKVILDALDVKADKIINSTKNEVELQLWNRAHLKALRIAALIAVGVDFHKPIIDKEIAEWAVDFVNREISLIAEKFKSGDIGTGESKQIADLKRTIQKYFDADPNNLKTLKAYSKFHSVGLIPYSYLNSRLIGMASFRNDKLSGTGALKRALQIMQDSGMLKLIDVQRMEKEFGTNGVFYVIGSGW